MEPVNSLVHKLRKDLPGILADHPVILAYLYGSAAQGTATPLSDVDIALVVDRRALATLARMDMELGIEVDLELTCGIENSDVRIVNDAPIAVRGAVVTEGILLYARDEDVRVDFETTTRKEYFDFRPIAEQQRNAFFADLMENGLYGQSHQS
jgi:predicted nucleotidyltransferase